MHRHQRITILILLTTVILSACNRMPDYATYIPKDAVAVAGINLKSLSKKIAWNVITGSKIFKEMQKRFPDKNAKDAMDGIEKAGINPSSTFYVYVKADNRFKGGNRITGLVPLSDGAAWESYIKQVFPKAEIKQNGDHKEASLGNDMYVGWSSNLLIIINVMSQPGDYGDAGTGSSPKPGTSADDLSAEMASAFNVPKESTLTGDKHFAALESEGHDVTFWLNYDQLMTQYSGDMAEKMGGVSLSNKLWKDAAFTCGIDFKKGKITGDMRYYMGDDVKDIAAEFGATNADKGMIDCLPAQNMDMLLTMHLSPKGIKSLLEKTQLLGLANIGLNPQGLSVDNVLDAFTGDMAIVMNDFSLKTETVTDNFMGQTVTHQNQKPSLSLSYVVKINKKDNFQKLLQLAKENGLQPINGGYVMPIDDKDSVYLMTNDQYAVISNKYVYASGFLNGAFKSQKLSPNASSAVTGHPLGLYVDIQQMFTKIDADISHSAHDSAMIAESKKLLSNVSVSGGEFKNNAFEYHMDINFTNTDENSILEIMDYVMKMSDADKIGQQTAN